MNISKLIVFFFLIPFLWSCNSAADSPYPTITFEKIKPMPGNGRASAVACVIGDKGYVTLGRDSNGTILKDCWEYDPTLDSWTQKASFPGTGRVKGIAAVVNGKAYIGLGFDKTIGVYNEKACLKDLWRFDPKLNTWTQMADLPSNFTNACGYFVLENTIYISNGFNGAGFNNETWEFNCNDGEKGKWVKMNDFLGPPRAGGVGCGNGEHFYFGTGYRTFSEIDWWEYLPTTDSWTQRKSMPGTGRENAVSLAINKRIFVSTGRHFGGNLTGGHVKSDILEYDIDLNVWYERGNIPDGERESAIAFTIAGKGYIGFGENDSKVLNDFWCFEPGNRNP